MEIAKMSAAQLTKAMEKASTESSKITQMMIDAGRGYEYPNEIMKKSDPLSLKYQKSAGLMQELYDEKNRRMTYRGNMRPIKYQGNPTMATKKFSPAQIAAQKLFAERARAGTLKKGKRKANPEPYNPYASKDMLEEYAGKTDDELRYIIKDAFAAARAQRGMQSEMKYLDQVNDANTVLYRRRKGLNEITGSKITKMKIERSETPDNPEGMVVTEAGALRFAKQNMPSDLKKAGFVASVFPGARGWVINYSAKGGRKPNPGLYDNINAKRARIAAGSGERMRKPGSKGAPTQEAFEQSALTAKRNPDKSKPRAYVKRASQITGAPPSKRLVSRRKMALKAPAGYFPNPGTGMMTGYQVICMHPKKHVVGIFKTMAEAKLVARAMADAKNVPYAVKTVKVHKAHFAV